MLRLKATLLSVLMLCCICCAGGFRVNAAEYTGKILAVYHEPVKVNTTWLDKVSVTLDNCAAPGQLVTVSYAPGGISEENHLGFIYRDLLQAARSVTMKNQFMNMVNGHVTVVADDTTKVVSKTTFWGYNWECGRNLDAGAAVGAAPQGGMGAAQQMPASAAQTQPAKRPGFGLPGVPGVPGVPGIGRFGF
ncbi:MAG: hypothetical protein AB7P76_11765 [Candidatus Melainabacteria bacterium]